jgi:hypothetical protein
MQQASQRRGKGQKNRGIDVNTFNHESSRIFFTREKSPFTCFFDGGEEKNFQFFSSPPSKKQSSNPLGWGGGLFDELF